MSFPEGVATATLTVSPGFTAMGTSPKVRVSVRPAQQVTHEATGEPLLPFESRTEYGVDPISVVLPIDDQPGFVDQAGNAVRLWGYRVIVYRKPEGGRDDKVERVVHLLAGQTTVDFDLIPDGESAAPVIGSPGFVTSVNGLTGAVLVGDLPGGDDGKSAYELAADAGFAGTVDEWLASLHGEDGDDGTSPTLPDLDALPYLPDTWTPDLTDYATTAVLEEGLAGKSDAGHTHVIADTDGLQDALDGKQPSGDYATNADLTDDLATKLDASEVSASLAGGADTSVPRRIDGRLKAETAVDGDDLVNKSQFEAGLAGKANIGAAVGYAALPAGVTLTVHYNDGWPARPTTRTDITVQWANAPAGSVPPEYAVGVDIIIRPVTAP